MQHYEGGNFIQNIFSKAKVCLFYILYALSIFMIEIVFYLNQSEEFPIKQLSNYQGFLKCSSTSLLREAVKPLEHFDYNSMPSSTITLRESIDNINEWRKRKHQYCSFCRRFAEQSEWIASQREYTQTLIRQLLTGLITLRIFLTYMHVNYHRISFIETKAIMNCSYGRLQAINNA